MRINLASVLVDDQEKALRFYTDVLGFKKKRDIPLGEHRWLTVTSAEDPNGMELVLEPDSHPAARPFKEALVAESHSPPLPSRTWETNSSDYGGPASVLLRNPLRWGLLGPRSSMTPAATSSRSSSEARTDGEDGQRTRNVALKWLPISPP